MAKPVELDKCVCKPTWSVGFGALVLFSLSNACGLPPLTSDDIHGSHGVALVGQVRDAEFHRQIPNASIYDAQTEKLLATTDSSGHYLIPSLKHRSYQLVARADRFEDNNFEVALQGTTQHQDVPLLRLPCDPRAGVNGPTADCFPEQEFCGVAGRCKWIYGAANLTVTLRNYCTAFQLDLFDYDAPPPDQRMSGQGGVFRITGRDVRSTAQISYVFQGGYELFLDARVYLAQEETLFKVRMVPTAADAGGAINCELVDAEHYCAAGFHWTNPQGGCVEDSTQP